MKRSNNFDEVIGRAKLALGVKGDAELAKLLGISPTAFSNRKQKQSLPYDRLVLVLNSHRVNIHWVITGDKNPENEGSLGSDQGKPIPFSILSTAQDRSEYGLSEYQRMPAGALVSSLNGNIVHSEQIVDYLAFKREWMKRTLGISHANIALLEVRGDSMADTLCEGDLVLIDTQQNALEISAVYAIELAHSVFIKRVQRNIDGSVNVKSDNSRYDTITIPKEQLKELNVLGRVIWPRLR